MAGKSKFDIAATDIGTGAGRRKRSPGPMGAAIRDTAENLQETTEDKIEQRRRNAADAKEYRAAQSEGRVLLSIPVNDIATDDLPRDRLNLEGVASSDEMEELKASIRQRGQREPLAVYRDADGAWQLKTGWRRLSALRQLFEESGDERFAIAIARVESGAESRFSRYVDMAEENIIREDLTFAEMAELAITAANDPDIEESDADAVVGRLYASLHKVKRSYIRSFVFLLRELEGVLKFPKALSRNLGVEIARRLKENPADAESLRNALSDASSQEEQNRILESFLSAPQGKQKKQYRRREKFEFHMDGLKVTARQGECRIVSATDFTELPREKLERAIRAFRDTLDN